MKQEIIKSTQEFREIDLKIEVLIMIAPTTFISDKALINLFKSNNNSNYYIEDFKKEISNGNILVALFADDPIAYVIRKNNKPTEIYIDEEFKDTNLRKILLNLKQL